MSNITKLKVKNFMSIGEAEIDLSDSIINFCGYNDSGKSALLKSLEILMYDSYSTKQVRFIKNGEEYFEIKAEFDDGISITKKKLNNGTNIWELCKGGQVLYTNKVGNAYAAVSGVPEPIAEYMGVLKDDNTKEKLNVRKKSDKLFLIQTTGGENYKILNEILKADVLANASKMLNEDRLKLQAEMIRTSTRYDTLREEYNSIRCVEESDIDTFVDMTNNLKASSKKLSNISSIKGNRVQISQYQKTPEVHAIDTSRLESIGDIVHYRTEAERRIPIELRGIDVEKLNKVRGIVESRLRLNIGIGQEVKTIDTERLTAIVKIAQRFNEIYAHNATIGKLDKAIEEANAESQRIIKDNNLRVCKNCGSLVD